MTAPSIFLAVPSDRGIHPACVQTIINLFSLPARGIGLRYRHRGDAPICRARDAFAADFLESPCSHLLFLDDDNALENAAAAVISMLADEKEVICGTYPMRGLKPIRGVAAVERWVCQPEAGQEPGRLMRATKVGMGFALIARSAFEGIRDNVPLYQDDHNHGRWTLATSRQWSTTASGSARTGPFVSDTPMLAGRSGCARISTWSTGMAPTVGEDRYSIISSKSA